MSQLSLFSRRISPSLISILQRQNIRPLCTPVNSSSQTSASANLNKGTHKVNNFERKLLVWTGKYKTANEVPGYVSQDVVERARNKFRIRTANIMMALTLIGCAIMIISGRRAVERGDSVLKMNQDWHKEYNEKSQAEALAKSEKK